MRRALPLALCALVLVPLGFTASVARAQTPAVWQDQAVRDEIADRVPKDLRGFYAARGNRPLWADRPAAALVLLRQLESAELDGADPRKLKPRDLAKAFERAERGDPEDLAKAEIVASRSFVRYVQTMRQAPRGAMAYESEALAPVVPTASAALAAAAAAPSLDDYVRAMGWMHPLYAPLRAALGNGYYGDAQRRQLALNLERVRALPAFAAGRHLLIDAAGARLWMYEGPRVVDSMKVVVGKPATQTPVMAGFVRQAVVNPYWNLPDDLMPSRVTDKVLAEGPGYLARHRMQVLSSWDEGAPVLDPRKVDWRAVAAGRRTIRARQLPGADNFMGRVKFTFPNPQGIYLHDTPERDLLTKPARQFSNGCVRLEDAGRLYRWLMGTPLPRDTKTPEREVALPELVPIYITYLTAMPENGRIAFRPDVYGRDGPGFAGSAQLAR